MPELNTIPEAIEEIKKGRIIIVVDDEDRENEGDFVTAARNATPEIINFMATVGRGLICVPLSGELCDKLDLPLMVQKNSSNHETAFTVSVDLLGYGCTTGISAHDRSKTIQHLINPDAKPSDFARPGHVFPLRAKTGGVLRRAGHTEAAVDLARMAGFEEAGVLVEIMNEDGTMARMPELLKLAKKYKLKIISIKDLIEYRMKYDSLIRREVEVDLPTRYGHFRLRAYSQIGASEPHLAIIKGTWKKNEPILVRVHSSCLTGDIIGSLRCDCGEQLIASLKQIEKAGKGVVLYMQQEGRGIGLLNKLKAYELQERGYDTYEANLALGLPMDARDYGVGAQILRDLGVTKMKLMTNNPKKRVGLIGYGLEIVENVPIACEPNPHNARYLKAKKDKGGHELNLTTTRKQKKTHE
ncbi:MAG: bifunctional 3,4-dihydroxy-2-butanone-4-phosphate synthase/GTP cyclohydrolase II [Chitinophagales bacterium]|nr:bifunctional 3,4-dihydroxy-2-butanone-4-phosphate synthase/GTP cyclohydrolase II [Chitinophagales bacterium]MDW8419179.1 bifunctional 3,4-dihydroxy-2-butanone-4-phosphate synthase/GTP cyclohydrolase II [Chitinophagales bacterium]